MKCERCQKEAEAHFILKPEKGEEEEAQEMHHFCVHCGRAFVAGFAAVRIVGYCANKLPGESELIRQFCVVAEFLHNRAFLEVAELRRANPGLRRWSVPAELVPEEKRYPGGEFTIQGNPLELEIFSTWFK